MSRPIRFMFRSSTSAKGSSSATNKAVSCAGTRPRTRAASKAGLNGASALVGWVGNSVLVKVGAVSPQARMSATLSPSSVMGAPWSMWAWVQ